MICPSCGRDNKNGYKFCVSCGKILVDPQKLNYGNIDMGGYHSEEEFSSGSKGFTMGSGTFIINDKSPSGSSSELYSSEELNSSEEEFDFSAYDEPYIPTLDTDRVAIPQTNDNTMRPVNRSTHYQQIYPSANNNNSRQMYDQPMYGHQQMQPPPQQHHQQVYGQPQVVGYDQGGMPVYGQPQQGYPQQPRPQVMGYDRNGMPIYGQPQSMYGQPPVIGYDAGGMPVYGQPQPVYPQQPPPQQVNNYDHAVPQGQRKQYNGQYDVGMQGIPAMPKTNTMMSAMPEPEPVQTDDLVDVPDDFWAFFDGGKATKRREPQADDFFSRSARKPAMNDLMPSAGGSRNDRRNTYMSDTPLVDAGDLRPNQASKYNHMFMKNTEMVDASELQANVHHKQQDRMRVTNEVDASRLNANEHYRSRVSMINTDDLGDATIETFVPKHREAMMAQADRAVEALPKKKKYVDELDLIELPDYMKAKKTVKEEKAEIPSLPEVGIDKK